MTPRRLVVRTADGASLAVERLRGGGPAVVMLHAGVADRRAWTDVAGDLNQLGADVVAYDRRGFGDTPAATSPFRQEDDLMAVHDAVSDGPVWLVGNSQGGRIALDLALLAPERVAGLVLIASAVSGAPEPTEDDLDEATRQLARDIERAEESGDLNALNRLEIRLWLDGPAGPEGRVGDPPRALALDMNARALASGMPEAAGGADHDTWARLEEIRVPATLACGELDLPEVIALCRVLSERLGDVRGTVELPGVAHLPALERPGLVTSVIASAMGL